MKFNPALLAFKAVCFAGNVKRTLRIKFQVRVLLLEYRIAMNIIDADKVQQPSA